MRKGVFSFVKYVLGAAIFFAFCGVAASEEITFGEDNITVGTCNLRVYTAINVYQKASGMLGFTDESFKKDGMIFLGDTPQIHYYHTRGMKMDIIIMGVVKTGIKSYKLSEKPIYAPKGIETIKVYGESVLEVPSKAYNTSLKDCLSAKNGKK